VGSLLNAAAGSGIDHIVVQMNAAAGSGIDHIVVQGLREARQLLDEGILTAAEFEQEQASLLQKTTIAASVVPHPPAASTLTHGTTVAQPAAGASTQLAAFASNPAVGSTQLAAFAANAALPFIPFPFYTGSMLAHAAPFPALAAGGGVGGGLGWGGQALQQHAPAAAAGLQSGGGGGAAAGQVEAAATRVQIARPETTDEEYFGSWAEPLQKLRWENDKTVQDTITRLAASEGWECRLVHMRSKKDTGWRQRIYGCGAQPPADNPCKWRLIMQRASSHAPWLPLRQSRSNKGTNLVHLGGSRVGASCPRAGEQPRTGQGRVHAHRRACLPQCLSVAA